jgi:hypothetical protein
MKEILFLRKQVLALMFGGRSQWPHNLRHEIFSLLKLRDHRFESLSRHECLAAYYLCVVLYR